MFFDSDGLFSVSDLTAFHNLYRDVYGKSCEENAQVDEKRFKLQFANFTNCRLFQSVWLGEWGF